MGRFGPNNPREDPWHVAGLAGGHAQSASENAMGESGAAALGAALTCGMASLKHLHLNEMHELWGYVYLREVCVARGIEYH